MIRPLTLSINGASVTHAVEPRETLVDVLRERCNLTATHVGCEHGACGACTVLIDGKAARSCLTLAGMAEGREITTLEGLADDAVTTTIKRKFHEGHALQCGFCTPGMLVMARDILARHTSPDAATIRRELAGHICRCTGYANIVAAIEAAGQELA